MGTVMAVLGIVAAFYYFFVLMHQEDEFGGPKEKDFSKTVVISTVIGSFISLILNLLAKIVPHWLAIGGAIVGCIINLVFCWMYFAKYSRLGKWKDKTFVQKYLDFYCIFMIASGFLGVFGASGLL